MTIVIRPSNKLLSLLNLTSILISRLSGLGYNSDQLWHHYHIHNPFLSAILKRWAYIGINKKKNCQLLQE